MWTVDEARQEVERLAGLDITEFGAFERLKADYGHYYPEINHDCLTGDLVDSTEDHYRVVDLWQRSGGSRYTAIQEEGAGNSTPDDDADQCIGPCAFAIRRRV